MSKLAKKPIDIPDGVEVKLIDDTMEVNGKLGTISLKILKDVSVAIENGKQINLKISQVYKQSKANWGTMTALLKNAIRGVNEGFTKTLEIEGIGFKASMEGNNLNLNVGFTHPVKFVPPAGIKITVEKNNIKISGIDKALVSQAAANIRKIKKPEPYKGKGIHYQGEVIRRKVGKKVAGTGAGGAA